MIMGWFADEISKANLITVTDLVASPWLFVGLVAALFAVKWIVLAVLARAFGLGTDQTMLFAFALAQGGEFAFVLFSFASGTGVLDDALVARLIVVVALSMATTP